MKNYFTLLKDAFKRLKVNFGTMLAFVVLYTVVAGAAAGVITWLMSHLAMAASGNSYLGTDNFVGYIVSPVTILCIFAALLVVGYLQMVEIGGLVCLFEASGRGEKMSLTAVVNSGIVSAVKLLRVRNWSAIFFLMIILPFLSMMPLSTIKYTLAIPGFINDYLLSKIWISVGLLVLNIVLFVYAVRWILSIHVFVIDPDSDFKQAKKESAELIHGKFFVTVLKTVVTGLLLYALATILTLIPNILILPISGSNTEDPFFLNNLVTLIISMFFMLVSPCVNIAFLSALFHDRKKEKGSSQPSAGPALSDGLRTRTKGVSWLIVAAFIVLFCALYAPDIAGYGTDVLLPPEIAAHRGSSKDAPENTMPAFELAVDQGASQWIEFDIHQTSDGEIIISHDDHIVKPPTDVTVHEVTLEELKKYDVGAWFSSEFAGTRISTLEEFFHYCENNDILLNLEIKPTKYDKDLVEKTLELVHESGIEDRIIISSLDADSLKKVKELEPGRITLYNMVVAAGDVGAIPYADWYGIEESNITQELVANVHENGGKVFVWTVNQPESIQFLIDSEADGINTDAPVEIEKAVTQADYHSGILRILRMTLQDPNFLQVFIY